jgi:hypothetical protein
MGIRPMAFRARRKASGWGLATPSEVEAKNPST